VLCSSGLFLYAVAAVAILLASHLLFRIISDRIQPLVDFEEEENIYVLSVTCYDANEFAIRSVIMKRLANPRLHLTDLQSADEIGGKVEIEARVLVSGRRKDDYVERLTAQISLEKGVTKAGWELV
jgi:uncharacterized membrane protein YhiD involved in acid resistance